MVVTVSRRAYKSSAQIYIYIYISIVSLLCFFFTIIIVFGDKFCSHTNKLLWLSRVVIRFYVLVVCSFSSFSSAGLRGRCSCAVVRSTHSFLPPPPCAHIQRDYLLFFF
uniref:Uncharacterized protein n=1 Tax=Trypanosoma congolense (strain IL3000) TaxID=1068625 RepID=G0UNQ0_TRYCI|nr:hypothetical protein, unlikely [Trypanosoma congolense IL3000]